MLRCLQRTGKLNISQNTFSRKVREEVAKIPRGMVASYEDIAARAGNSKAALSVANALGDPGDTPGWHRVVRTSGLISPRLPDSERLRQRRLLQTEGVRFDGWRVRGFDFRIRGMKETL